MGGSTLQTIFEIFFGKKTVIRTKMPFLKETKGFKVERIHKTLIKLNSSAAVIQQLFMYTL